MNLKAYHWCNFDHFRLRYPPWQAVTIQGPPSSHMRVGLYQVSGANEIDKLRDSRYLTRNWKILYLRFSVLWPCWNMPWHFIQWRDCPVSGDKVFHSEKIYKSNEEVLQLGRHHQYGESNPCEQRVSLAVFFGVSMVYMGWDNLFG